MAKYKKGQTGNPDGRPKGQGPLQTRPDLKHVKLMTPDLARRLIQKLMDMTQDELRALVSSPFTPMMELMVARVIDKALSEGDVARLNFLFDRTVGKVLEKHELELKPVVYRTRVTGDGSLIQEVADEELAASGSTTVADAAAALLSKSILDKREDTE